MKFTGERYLPNLEGEIYLEHFHRYNAIIQLVENKVVLDIACGEGYGTDLLSTKAKHIYGVDISSESVEHAKKKYLKNNMEFRQGSTSEIPMENNSVDCVISFETIEHHDEHEQMMKEIKRVLKPDGLLIISSPDKENYNKTLPEPNKFHVKELEFFEFKQLIQGHFQYSKFFFQNIVYGSMILLENDNYFNYIKKDESFIQSFKPKYDICIASNNEIKESISSFFIGNHFLVATIENYKSQLLNMQNSLTWKIGRFFLSPFTFLKK